MLGDLLFLIAWCYVIVLSHELGHFYMADKLGYKPKLGWFSCKIDRYPTLKDDFKISTWGVLAGFVPLFLASTIFTPFISLSLTLIYLVGVREDLTSMFKYTGVLK